METENFEIDDPNMPDEAGGQRAERQWRQRVYPIILHFQCQEAGGQRAERQWRPLVYHHGSIEDGERSRRAESRKAMETLLSFSRLTLSSLEAGGQRAERQWRPEPIKCKMISSSSKPEGREPKGNGDIITANRHRPSFWLGSRRAESRKAMETGVFFFPHPP